MAGSGAPRRSLAARIGTSGIKVSKEDAAALKQLGKDIRELKRAEKGTVYEVWAKQQLPLKGAEHTALLKKRLAADRSQYFVALAGTLQINSTLSIFKLFGGDLIRIPWSL